MRRYALFVTSIVSVLSLFLLIYSDLIYFGQDNRGCSVHYAGLEREWLNSDVSKIKKHKDINNQDVLDYVDAYCKVESIFAQIDPNESVDLKAIATAQVEYYQSHKKVCPYFSWWCLLYPPEEEELARVLTLIYKQDPSLFVVRSKENKGRLLVYYQTPITSHTIVTVSYSAEYEETFTILRICPVCTEEAAWQDCPLQYITRDINWKHSYSSQTYDQYGFIISTNHMTIYGDRTY